MLALSSSYQSDQQMSNVSIMS